MIIISSKKHTQSQNFEFINTFISSIKEPIIVLNDDKLIIAYNKAFSEKFNMSDKRMKGTSFFNSKKWCWNNEIIKKKYNAVQKHHQNIEGIELPYKLKGQEQKVLNLDIKPIFLGEKKFYILSISEINEEKSTQELLKEIQIRDQISEIFLNTSDEQTYHEVLKIILDIMESKIGYFGYINEEGALVSPSLTREVWDKCQVPDKNIVFPKENWGGIWGESLRKKKSIIKNESLKPPKGHVPLKNVLCVPIFHQKEIIGQIVVGNKKIDYTEKDKELLEKIANQISPILYARLERDRKEQEVQKIEEKLRKSATEERVDSVDKQILHQLYLNGKKSLNQIKKKVFKSNGQKMSHTGINNRIDKLDNSDILKIQGNVNLKELGFQAAFILVELIKYDTIKEYITHAKQCPRIFLVAPTTGSYHLILGIVGKNIEHINNCLNQCDLVGREEIKDSEIMFAPQLEVPRYIPIDLFQHIKAKEELMNSCKECESYKTRKCSGCGL